MFKRASILAIALVAGSSFAQTASSPAGRLLASNCFQCHGTNGSGGFDRLAGESAREIVSELKEMRTKSQPGIMEVHARGYSDAQLQLIGAYFASLGSTTTTTSTSSTSSSLSPFIQQTKQTTITTKKGKNDD